METLELLMSAMHQRDFSLAKTSNVNSDLLIINQCDTNGEVQENIGKNRWRMLSTTERGLSKSRNMAIENATGNICLLCDDDEILADNYPDIILKAYNDLPDADVIVFNLYRINYNMKKKYYSIKEVRLAPQYRSYGSPMITFKLNKIKSKNIHFNEIFGSGSKFGGGEDNLFLSSIREAGLKIYEHPAVIATIDYARYESKWFHGYDNRYFYNLGVFFEYLNPNKPLPNILWGLYHSIKLRREKINPFKIIKWRLAGAKGFREGEMTYEEYIKFKQL